MESVNTHQGHVTFRHKYLGVSFEGNGTWNPSTC